MQQERICLALADQAEAEKLNRFLTAAGFQIADTSFDGASAIRRIRALRPDLIIVDSFLPVMSGEEIAKIAEEDRIAPSIILKPSEQEKNIWAKPGGGWDFAYIYRPLSKSSILQTIRLVLMNHKRVTELETEINKLKSNLDSRRTVEKAKGLLMDRLGLSEQDAYRRIQKQSMDKGVTMKELSEAIIMTYEMAADQLL